MSQRATPAAAKSNGVWVPDPKEGYIMAEVLEDAAESKTIKVKDCHNKIQDVSRGQLYPANPDNVNGVPDNTQLMHLHEPGLMHNLKVRYLRDEIYTYTAYILIAVNPYKRLPIYGDDLVKAYQGKSMGVLPPHAYAVADRAYRSMKSARKSQSVIISGESGAGKTENSKIVMQYLASVGGAAEGVLGALEQRIIQCNPILESFGNAKTLRNDNSSRFGKFTKLLFDRSALVSGASIVTYLLEKSRLVSQATNERNYHVFYQLCAGASPSEREHLALKPAEGFHYINQSGCFQLNNVDDGAEYTRLRSSMSLLQFSPDEQMAVFEVVAGILHMGNIEFKGLRSSEGLSIVNEEPLNNAARLLRLSPSQFSSRLTNKTIKARGESYTSPLTEQQAVYSRDALAKMIYTRLFDYIVEKINQSLTGPESLSFIGVLDIYGFEYFETNTFEQFCINLANEKLQQHFNHQVLRQEQEIYQREGIQVAKIEFVDNQDCIDLIEKKGTGILSILDEECRLPKPSSKNFCEKIHSSHGKSHRLSAPKPGKNSKSRLNQSEGFMIKHFAGEVTYTAELFLDKNNDSLNPDLADLVKSSESQFIQNLFRRDADAARKNKFESVGSKFTTQLAELMENLNETVSHFIRCVKPNTMQRPGVFDGMDSLNQLRCSGMLEALLLMHEGFPTRCPYEDLYDRYCDLVPPILSSMDSASFCEALFMALDVDKSEFQLGVTKVFFRAGRLAFLDDLRGSEYKELAADIAEKVTKWLARKRFRRAIWVTRSCLNLMRRIHEMRAYKKLASVSLSTFLISSTLIKRGRRLRRERAATIVQKSVRRHQAERKYRKKRQDAIRVQARIRGFLMRKKYVPILAERRAARIAKQKEEEEAIKRLKAEERALRLEAEKQRLEIERQQAEARRLEKQKREQQREAEEAEQRRLEKEAQSGVLSEEAKKKLEESIANGLRAEREAMAAQQQLEREQLSAAKEALRAMEDKISGLANQMVLLTTDDSGKAKQDRDRELLMEVRLKELEHDFKESNKRAAEEKAARLELEKLVKGMQTMMKAQMADLTKRLEEEHAARVELEKRLYSLQEKGLAMPPVQIEARARATSLSRKSAPSASSTPRLASDVGAGAGAPVSAASGATAPAQTHDTSGYVSAVVRNPSVEAESTDDGVIVPSPGNIIDAAREGIVLASEEQVPRSPKTQVAPEPILRLRAAVDEIKKHFSQVTSNKMILGDDCQNPVIGGLVRGGLCSALGRIFWHGFKSYKIFGRYHLWDFFERVRKELDEGDKNSPLSLCRAIETVNKSHEAIKKNDMRFRSLVCYGLTHKILHVWISLLGEDEPVVSQWFNQWSYIRSPVIRAQIVSALQPLVEYPLCMSLDYELSNWDLQIA